MVQMPVKSASSLCFTALRSIIMEGSDSVVTPFINARVAPSCAPFQLCVGHFPDGRMRTFWIGGVRPDLSADDVAAVARAVAPLLAYPVVRVRFVRKYTLDAPAGPGAAAAPKNNPENPEANRIFGAKEKQNNALSKSTPFDSLFINFILSPRIQSRNHFQK